jgi:glucosyl-3-phosphoglycerate synthase
MAAVRIVPPTTQSVADLVALKAGRTVSVCIPARNEVGNVGPICRQIVGALMRPGEALVDELLVFDDGSTDTTAAAARNAGATVVRVADILPDAGPGSGKGNVLWKSVAASTGDIIVWCDADLTSFSPAYVTRMIAPLLEDSTIDLVKAFYERLVDERGAGGGRVTELVARPMLSRYFPELATVLQPLGGEYAGRRSLLERLPFFQSYGVETGILIDTLRLVGLDRIAQVDLGYRGHRHRPLHQLTEQAAQIIAVILQRAGVADAEHPPLIKADGDVVPVLIGERPAHRQ